MLSPAPPSWFCGFSCGCFCCFFFFFFCQRSERPDAHYRPLPARCQPRRRLQAAGFVVKGFSLSPPHTHTCFSYLDWLQTEKSQRRKTACYLHTESHHRMRSAAVLELSITSSWAVSCQFLQSVLVKCSFFFLDRSQDHMAHKLRAILLISPRGRAPKYK